MRPPRRSVEFWLDCCRPRGRRGHSGGGGNGQCRTSAPLPTPSSTPAVCSRSRVATRHEGDRVVEKGNIKNTRGYVDAGARPAGDTGSSTHEHVRHARFIDLHVH